MQSLLVVCVPMVSWKALCLDLAGVWGDSKCASQPGGILLCKVRGTSSVSSVVAVLEKGGVLEKPDWCLKR